MVQLENFLDDPAALERQLGYQFGNRNLLAQAFIHCSFVNEHRDLENEHNERLEFLGDAVLDLLVSEELYRRFPSLPEGQLSHLRSRLVQASACAAYVAKLGVGDAMKLGKGEQMAPERGRESIHADLFEAIVGAIFLDGGVDAVKRFLFENFTPEIDILVSHPQRNTKADLQDYTQRVHHETPEYIVVEESGPDHEKQYIIDVAVHGEVLGRGEGPSKKEAQQQAAAAALEKIEGGQ